MLRSITLLLVLVSLTATPGRGQGHTCSQRINLPTNLFVAGPNTRHMSDLISDVRHPFLSFNGFTCAASANCPRGRGLREVLHDLHDDELVRSPLEYIMADLAAYENQGPLPTPNKNNSEINIRRVQYLALTSVLTFLVEHSNGAYATSNLDCYIGSQLGARQFKTHSQEVAAFKALLLNTNAWRISFDFVDKEPIHWIGALENLARMIDLYLALENLYLARYSEAQTAQALLTADQKKAVMRAFGESIHAVQQERHRAFMNVYDRYTWEHGNWSLFHKAVIGYASLTYQNVPGESGDWNFTPNHLDNIAYGFRATLGSDIYDDDENFSWQTQGQKFFAEGPYYFAIVLPPVVGFLHAVRQSGLMGRPSVTRLGSPYTGDPFTQSRFTNSFRWLARIATPDGHTPTIDDANKYAINVADLMKWRGTYGDDTTGTYYSVVARDRWCRGQQKNPDGSFCADLLTVDPTFGLLQLAIPQRAATPAESLPSEVGNTFTAAPRTPHEQQSVVRFSEGDGRHQILLNAETRHNGNPAFAPSSMMGEAITHGEHHEQPDNMHLLYYFNNLSVTADAGYTCGNVFTCAQYREYYRNSVVFRGNSDGGLASNTHVGIGHSYYRRADSITVVSARQSLEPDIDWSPTTDASQYYRDVVVVRSQAPYLIDLNRNVRDQNETSDACTFTYRLNLNAENVNTANLLNATGHGFAETDGLWTFDPNNGAPIKSSVKAYVFPSPIGGAVRDGHGQPFGLRTVMPRTFEFGENNGLYTRWLDVCDDGSKYFGVINVIRASSTPPAYRPRRLLVSSTQGNGAVIWQQGATTYDVFIARSIAQGGGTAIAKANPRMAGTEFPNLWLGVPTGRQYGFARLQWNGSPSTAPTLVPGYTLDLQETTPIPLHVALAGPSCAIAGQPSTFHATASGGLPPYVNYAFEILPECSGGGGGEALAMQGEGPPTEGGEILSGDGGGGGGGTLDGLPCGGGSSWSNAGYGPNPFTTVTQNVSYRIRVRATDNDARPPDGQPVSATSGEWSVSVGSWCPGEGGGGVSETPVEAPALAPTPALPATYALDLPVPNPFAARARFRFALPEDAPVRLVAYDVLGRQVAVLAEGPTPAGWHEASLDGAGLPRGLYVVRLTAGAFTQTRTVTLAR